MAANGKRKAESDLNLEAKRPKIDRNFSEVVAISPILIQIVDFLGPQDLWNLAKADPMIEAAIETDLILSKRLETVKIAIDVVPHPTTYDFLRTAIEILDSATCQRLLDSVQPCNMNQSEFCGQPEFFIKLTIGCVGNKWRKLLKR